MGSGLIERTTGAPAKIAVQTDAGIAPGAIVLTLSGEMPVEDLVPGDRIITRDTGMAVLRDVRKREMTVTPVRIKAGSLGHTRPDRDVVIGPQTLVLIRDWRAEAMFGKAQALVPASRLVDGEFVAKGDEQTVTFYELVFDAQHVVYSDGLEIASVAP